MSELEKTKNVIIQNMQRLCAHCANGNFPHSCPVQQLSKQIENIRGVPLIVNNEFRGVIFR
jgi:nitrate reductase beta subunit